MCICAHDECYCLRRNLERNGYSSDSDSIWQRRLARHDPHKLQQLARRIIRTDWTINFTIHCGFTTHIPPITCVDEPERTSGYDFLCRGVMPVTYTHRNIYLLPSSSGLLVVVPFSTRSMLYTFTGSYRKKNFRSYATCHYFHQSSFRKMKKK